MLTDADQKKANLLKCRAAEDLAKAFALYGIDEFTAEGIALAWAGAAVADVRAKMAALHSPTL